MLKHLVAISAMLVFILAVIGCSDENTHRESLGEKFALSIGQSATIASDKLSIKFLDIIGDSRCPKGVTCVWAGEVSCMLQVTRDGKGEQVKLTEPGGSTTNNQIVSGYLFVFHVDPYPESGKQIAKEDYRLNLTITK